MSNKPSPAPRIAPLQRVVAEPIVDPIEQAALDEQRKEHRQADQTVGLQGGGLGLTLTSAVLELWRHLPPEEMPTLLSQLMGQLSPEGKLQLLKQWVDQLQPEGLRQMEQALHARIGNGSH